MTKYHADVIVENAAFSLAGVKQSFAAALDFIHHTATNADHTIDWTTLELHHSRHIEDDAEVFPLTVEGHETP
jgi:hypothetical protein